MATKVYTDKGGKYSTITYSPSILTSNDLEAATKTITRTSEVSGVGNADYSSSLTIPVPTDARLAIMRITNRLSVTIDSDDGSHYLRCRVYIDVQDSDHLLHDLTFSSTGNQLAVQDCLIGTKETIFNLLKDGAAHTAYIFFWTPGNHAPVISVVQTWRGVGSSIVGAGTPIMTLTHSGLVSGFYSSGRIGSGSNSTRVGLGIMAGTYQQYLLAGGTEFGIPLIMSVNFGILLNTSVATDIAYISRLEFCLRSE
jgi:hypothetical protein